MFNEEERKKELIEITYLLSFFKDRYEKAIDLIISQEKSMIEQAKKEVREEFAVKLKDEMRYDYHECKVIDVKVIDKLLKEYEE